MKHRFLFLAVLVLFVGFVTRAFAQNTTSTPITRAGAVALMVEANPALQQRLQHFVKHLPPMPLFDDMDYRQWYAPYIETAFEAGLITGNADGRFRPSENLTEEESIGLVNRIYAYTHPGTSTVRSDVAQDWFTATINQAIANGVQLPSSVRIGVSVERGMLFSMMRSIGIAHPEQVVISYKGPSAPVVVQQSVPANTQVQRQPQPVAARPVAIAYRPQQPAQQPTRTAVAPPVVRQPVSPTRTVVTQAQSSTPKVVPKGFSISLPSLGINNLNVIHPTNPTTKEGLLAPLQNGVGHLFSYPGAGGTILIYGHSSSYAWDVSKYTKIFRQINKLAIGDIVSVNYNGKAYSYKVTYKQTVPANDLSAYKGGRGEELILYTCWPPDSIKERYLVHAVPVSEVALK